MDYKVVKYSEIGKIRSGKRLPKGYTVSEEISKNKYIRVRDINNGSIDSSIVQYITDEAAEKLERYRVKTRDVIISVVGTVGAIAQIDESLNGAYLTENCDNLQVDESLCLKDYLKYYLLSEDGSKEIIANTVGSTQPKLPIYGIENFNIKLPSIDNQKRIVKLLNSIDKKVKLNNKINNNLYDLLRTNYDDIFNNDDSRKIRLEEIVSIRRGASPRPIQEYLSEKGVNWLKISDVTGIDSPFIYSIKEKIKDAGKSKSVFINKGTLVVSNSATPGIPKYIMVDTCVHDGWLILSEYDEKYRYYLYFLIEKIREKLISLSNGSVFNNLKTDILKGFMIGLPSDEQLESFNYLATPIMHNINSNTKENIELEQLRDTLLPKLMNGEIGLDNIEI